MSSASTARTPIPLRIHLSFFLLAVLLGMSSRDPVRIAAWVAVVFVSVLLHEFGHALVARAFGYAPRIELHGFGGTTHFDQRADGSVAEAPTPLRRALISFAGPLAGMLFGTAVYFVARRFGVDPTSQGSLASAVVRYALLVNIGWGVFNLLPVLPLDGGQITHAALDALTKGRGAKPAYAVSIAISVALAVVAARFLALWPAAMMALFALQNGRAFFAKPEAAEEKSAGEKSAPPSFDARYREAVAAVKKADPRALELAKELVAQAQSPEQRVYAAQALAYAYVAEGDGHRAQIVLETMIPEGQRPTALVARVATQNGEPARALEVLRATPAAGGEPTFEPASQQLARWEAEVAALRALGRIDEVLERWRGDATLRALGHTAGKVTAHALFEAGRYAECARVCAEFFERDGHPDAAYNAACSYARIGDVEAGVRWLNRAAGAGFPDAPGLEADEDLAPLRAHPGYAAAVAQVRANAA